ncbi:hypothetical protein [Marinobacterium lutimaris]|uniref:Uncharacterized protein n=1 Tax=Marinobacterium lutimaris TaxID=568106 RepID=A0A1H6AKU5_9GAMM|nr:hypothetical protein [Marinobacterium lutimaris]SEG49318.1 hypothetical protein SAMN05444390_10289 [Marinobacterium lutimaris]
MSIGGLIVAAMTMQRKGEGMPKTTAAPAKAGATVDKPTSIIAALLVSGMLTRRKALEFPLPWRDQIEALPDNARLNIGSTNPLAAAESHRKRQQSLGYCKAVYQPPAAPEGFVVYLSSRECEILTYLRPGHWVLSASLKGKAETRRPLATLREFGLIIITSYQEGGDSYRLLGSITLTPSPSDLTAAIQVVDLLPDRETAASIERQRARSAFAKRLALIEKRASHLRPGTDPKQLLLPDSAA